MRKLRKFWQTVNMTTVKKNKTITYKTHLCPKCEKESLVATNYCAHCGKKLRKKVQ